MVPPLPRLATALQSAPEISWAESSNRLYINDGCATMADIYEFRSDNLGAKGPLYHFDQVKKVSSHVALFL